jgi:hypothetical protein
VRYQSLNLPLQPKFELSQQMQPKVKLFGKIGTNFLDNEVKIEAGHENWGKLAGLSSNHVGISGNHVYDFGQLFATADLHYISDGNRIVTSKLDYKPAWTPLGTHVKPYVGMETRDAQSNTLVYWSPAIGFGTAYAGLQGEMGQEDWSVYGGAQLGTHLYGEAGNSWSVSAGSKIWLLHDLALDLGIWKMQSRRNNAVYRAKSFNMGLEKLWG